MGTTYNIDLDQAEDFELPMTLKTTSGTPINLTGATGSAAVRSVFTGAVLAPMSLTFAADRTTGKITVSLSAADIKTKLTPTALSDYTTYSWDLRLVIGGKKRRFLLGSRVSVADGGADE